MKKDEDGSPTDVSPISIIRELQNGSLRADALAPASRRACIEHLHVESYSAAEIAEVFKISVRTVRRDLAQIREGHAVVADSTFVARIVGELVQEAECSIGRLRRIARDRDCPHAAKVDAERAAWSVMREFVEKLQSLGYLPTAAQQIQADLTHRLEGDRLATDLLEVKSVIRQVALPADAPAAKELSALMERRAVLTAAASSEPPAPKPPEASSPEREDG